MPFYSVPYTGRYGKSATVKIANTPEEAIELVKKKMSGLGMSPTYGKPVLLDPQPFTDEYRASVEKKK